jgi:hypothetical protein
MKNDEWWSRFAPSILELLQLRRFYYNPSDTTQYKLIEFLNFHSTLVVRHSRSGKQVWNFGHCILRFIWNLSFAICDLIAVPWNRKIYKTNPSFVN